MALEVGVRAGGAQVERRVLTPRARGVLVLTTWCADTTIVTVLGLVGAGPAAAVLETGSRALWSGR